MWQIKQSDIDSVQMWRLDKVMEEKWALSTL